MNIIFFLVCVGHVATCGLSLAVESRGYSLAVERGLLIVVASVGAEHRFSSCGTQA